jgi:hypothetical protein
MPSASDSAYPRLKANRSAKELSEIYPPKIFELFFPRRKQRGSPLYKWPVIAKTFRRLGLSRYTAMIFHIARCADYLDVPAGLDTLSRKCSPRPAHDAGTHLRRCHVKIGCRVQRCFAVKRERRIYGKTTRLCSFAKNLSLRFLKANE